MGSEGAPGRQEAAMDDTKPNDESVTPYDDPHRWLPRLGRLLDEQLALAGTLDEMSREQTQTLAAGDAEGVLEIVCERDGIVQRMADLAVEVEPFVRRMGSLASQMHPEDRTALRARLDRLDEMLGAIEERDAADRAVLESRREALGRDLATLAKGRHAHGAYGGDGGVAPLFQDRQG